MALGRKRRLHQDNIWPGFVDALATLLMVIIFLLMMFVLAQVFLSETLSGRENTLQRVNAQMAELSDLLNLERKTNTDLRTDMSSLSGELQASLRQRDDLSAQVAQLERQSKSINEQLEAAFSTMEADRETLEIKLASLAKLENDVVALQALRDELQQQIAQQARELNEKDGLLLEVESLSDSQRAQNALMNQQMSALRQQLASLQESLEASESLNENQKVQIQSLGNRLNAALATKVQELNKYRSEFFGELRKILGNQSGVRIVGDRFVFQSEVLFNSGEATLGPAGQDQLQQLAGTLLEISAKIPEKVDWILRVDGHTDDIPISTAQFPSNWELSTQRAISVVKELITHGIPANRLAATGFGEFQPLDGQQDEIARRRNRRIEIKLTQR